MVAILGVASKFIEHRQTPRVLKRTLIQSNIAKFNPRQTRTQWPTAPFEQTKMNGNPLTVFAFYPAQAPIKISALPQLNYRIDR